MDFRDYLLVESSNKYFGKKIGTVLTAIHELLEAGKQVGARNLVDHSKNIASQLRKILHTSWAPSNKKYLFILQKCGVAIMKSIDEKGNLTETLERCSAEIEHILKKLKVPLNTLGSPSNEDEVESEVEASPSQSQNPEPDEK